MDVDDADVSDSAACGSDASDDGDSTGETELNLWEDVASDVSDDERDDVDDVLGLVDDDGADLHAQDAETILPVKLLDLDAAVRDAKGRKGRRSSAVPADSDDDEEEDEDDDDDNLAAAGSAAAARDSVGGRESADGMVNTHSPAATGTRDALAGARAGQPPGPPLAPVSSSAMEVDPQDVRAAAPAIHTPLATPTGCGVMTFEGEQWVRCNRDTTDRHCGTLHGT